MMQEVAGCGRLFDCEELVGVLTGGDGPENIIYFLIHQPSHYFFILK
tara:strand:+ start:356 stop:496 length:141 start_codon:yes stop_codon:yes gene_type:complete